MNRNHFITSVLTLIALPFSGFSDARNSFYKSIDRGFKIPQGEGRIQGHIELKVGDTIFLPRKVSHAWIQLSERGKMLVTMQPAGKLENFFVVTAALDHTPSEEEISKLFLDNEMEIAGPLLTSN